MLSLWPGEREHIGQSGCSRVCITAASLIDVWQAVKSENGKEVIEKRDLADSRADQAEVCLEAGWELLWESGCEITSWP